MFLLVLLLVSVSAGEWHWPDQPMSTQDNHNKMHIPRKMHFIWMQKNLLTEEPTSETERDNAENVRATMQMNPGYETHFYDDTACRRECRQTGIAGVPEIYEAMRGATSFGPSPWANMANVCRIAILYNHGGVYMDANMAMRLPFREWLRKDVEYVAPTSVCEYKRDFFTSLLGSVPRHQALRFTLEFMVRDWDSDSQRFKGLDTYYENPKQWCPNYAGTIFTYLGWNATTRENTQLLDERIHRDGTFLDVQRRRHENGYPTIGCSTIVVDPYTGLVPFYSHSLKKAKCVLVGEPQQHIPRKMHFIWMQKNLLAEELTTKTERDNAENVRATMQMNPEYETLFYDDAACRRECRRAGIAGVPELYEAMRGVTMFGPSPWASMSDVCRMAVLYNHGGVYMDTNMAMRLPFKKWLRKDVYYVGVTSACEYKRDFFNSLLGAVPKHQATRMTLDFMVRDWDSELKQFKDLWTYYTPPHKKWCFHQMGTIYSYLGWNATSRKDTQLLDERLHLKKTFTDVPRRALTRKDDGWYFNSCNMIVADPDSGLVPFYSHMLKRRNCTMEEHAEL